MSVVAQSSKRVVIAAKQTDFGTIAPTTSVVAHAIRRKTTTVVPSKNTFESKEKREDGQTADFGHGLKKVEGDINMELTPGSFTEFWAAIVRRDFTALGTTSAAAADEFTMAANNVLTRANGANSFITDGHRLFDIVRMTGLATAGDNGRNARIVALSAGSMTLRPLTGLAFATFATDATATVVGVGKKSFIPTTGHTEDCFTLEDKMIDRDIGTVMQDCRVTKVDVSVMAGDYVDVTFHFIGAGNRQYLADAGSPYFTSPVAASITKGFTGIKAQLTVNGVVVPIAKSFKFSIDWQGEALEVIASDTSPDVVYGPQAIVSGEFAAYVRDNTIDQIFDDETIVPIDIAFFAPGATLNAFFGVAFPTVKLNGAERDDPDKAIQRTVPFRSILPDPVTGTTQSSFILQDSTLT